MTTTRARRLAASAVVLVLAGTPVAASACALWCPPGGGHGGADARRAGVTTGDAVSAGECATRHRHDRPTVPADASASAAADAGVAVPERVEAASQGRSAPALAATEVCCAVPVADAVRATAPVDTPGVQAPPLQVADVLSPLAPLRHAQAAASRPPAALRATRALVLRI